VGQLLHGGGVRLLRVVDVGIGFGLIGFGGLLAYRSASDS
jgi:hypothetical protein